MLNSACVVLGEEVFTKWEPHSSHMLFFIFPCRVQTNWKSLRSEALSMDQGNGIYPFQ